MERPRAERAERAERILQQRPQAHLERSDRAQSALSSAARIVTTSWLCYNLFGNADDTTFSQKSGETHSLRFVCTFLPIR
ncbi:hypothetical protein [Paenibacillus montanisoli]|uniref:hypothetical protein n=1 Tax=Paenibacillus montanisoli TaxID=2081970 RepID=UPI0010578BF3|nr:hypothetical protein [Paenibacillus montanisoli]